MALPNGLNLLSGSNDTPSAAMRRGQSFWRFQYLYTPPTPGTSPPALLPAPYVPLGNVVPAAIAIGPNSDIDTVRAWYVPPANPAMPYYQDISPASPLTSPLPYYTGQASINGSIVTPGIYIYLCTNTGAYGVGGADFFGYNPVCPRYAQQFNPGGGLVPGDTIYFDLLVYFQDPGSFPGQRAPINGSSNPISGSQPTDSVRTVTADTSGGSQNIWKVCTAGRRRGSVRITTGVAMDFLLVGWDAVQGLHTVLTITNQNGENSWALNPIDFEFMALVCTDSGGGANAMQYMFEFFDS